VASGPEQMVYPSSRKKNACCRRATMTPTVGSGPIVRFAILSAMRQGRDCGAPPGPISISKKHTAVVRGAAGIMTKNGEIREVPLLPAAIRLLESIPRANGGRVFPIDQNVLKMRYRARGGRVLGSWA